jgi:hypothetical protein
VIQKQAIAIQRRQRWIDREPDQSSNREIKQWASHEKNSSHHHHHRNLTIKKYCKIFIFLKTHRVCHGHHHHPASGCKANTLSPCHSVLQLPTTSLQYSHIIIIVIIIIIIIVLLIHEKNFTTHWDPGPRRTLPHRVVQIFEEEEEGAQFVLSRLLACLLASAVRPSPSNAAWAQRSTCSSTVHSQTSAQLLDVKST